MRSAQVLLAGALIFLGACAVTPSNPVAPPPPATVQEPRFEDKPLPRFEDWIDREIREKNQNPDLVVAATVIASQRSGRTIPSSAIPRWLHPVLEKARARIAGASEPERRLDALIAELIPELKRRGSSDLRWLHETLGGEEGPCAVNSLLFLIAGDALGLELDPHLIPSHVLVSLKSGEKRRHVETTDQGQHWSPEEYRLFLLKTPTSLHQLAEDPDALARSFQAVPRRHFLAMLLCQGAGKRPEGEAHLDLAARLAPDSYMPYQKLAGYHGTLDNFAVAEDYMTLAIARAPHLPGLLLARASNRGLLAKVELSLSDIQAALRLAPHVPRYHHSLGLAYFSARRFDEAQRAFAQAAKDAPREAEYQIFHAMALEKLGKYPEAIEACTEAIALQPKKAEYYKRRSKLWALAGDDARFKADLEKAKALSTVP